MDRTLAIASAAVGPLLVLLVGHHILSASDAEPIAALVAALVAGYHVNNDKARAALNAEPADL